MTKQYKWLIGISCTLNLILVIALISVWPSKKPPPVRPRHTQQDLKKAFQIHRNMTTNQVEKIMGQPIVREIDNAREEWHYCTTGESVDEYVAITFDHEKATRLTNYTVSWLDMVFHYMKSPTKELIEAISPGDCKITVRWGTYNQKTPSYPSNLPSNSDKEPLALPR